MAVRSQPEQLRVAFLAYRGNPRSGGQGVYTRFLSRELARLGHQVTVFAGQPWPNVAEADGARLVKVPSLDLYREPDPFRLPGLSELRGWPDFVEVATMLTGGFPEPRTFSMRAWRLLAGRRQDFDLLHDNQSFGSGVLRFHQAGWPVVGTCHHPVTVDRLVEMAKATSFGRRLSIRRWYGFVRMQNAVARQLPRILTVSSSSRRDIVEQMGVPSSHIAVVPIGTDADHFSPAPAGAAVRVPGRIMTTASADVPMKGLAYLLEAVAKLRTEQPEAHLVVVGEPRRATPAQQAMDRLGLDNVVTFRPGVSDAELVQLYREAMVVAVPSLYEGFSLPAVEAMACQVPVVACSGGALPEVLGPDGEAAFLVPPGDAGALAAALGRVLGGPTTVGEKMGRAGRRRVLARFTWARCAGSVVEQYRSVLESGPGPREPSRSAEQRSQPLGPRENKPPRAAPPAPAPKRTRSSPEQSPAR
ncbi:MAG TPA: glycosyltransferase family 4 protein [Acidimicrobiales bacterium]|nr:glycosyltransferase family 4 protein [Acidimicrobiales bacterium]